MSQSGYDIEYYGTDDDGLSNFIRALLGSLSIIGCMICTRFIVCINMLFVNKKKIE